VTQTVHSSAETMSLGVVIERRDSDHRWQTHSWRAVGVIAGAPPIERPRLLRRGEGWAQYHAATLDIVLHRTDTEGYKHNIRNETIAKVFVVLRSDDDDEDEAALETDEGEAMPRPFFVTACPFEASVYLDTTAVGEDVETVPMPAGVIAWVDAFVAKHHVDRPFEKKKKKRWFQLQEDAHAQMRGPGGGRRGGPNQGRR
jgi:hypothetical protein